MLRSSIEREEDVAEPVGFFARAVEYAAVEGCSLEEMVQERLQEPSPEDLGSSNFESARDAGYSGGEAAQVTWLLVRLAPSQWCGGFGSYDCVDARRPLADQLGALARMGWAAPPSAGRLLKRMLEVVKERVRQARLDPYLSFDEVYSYSAEQCYQAYCAKCAAGRDGEGVAAGEAADGGSDCGGDCGDDGGWDGVDDPME